MKYREVARKLHRLGCEEIPRRSGGSHRKWHNPATEGFASIPDWGSRDLKIGTLRHIISQLGLDWETFKRA
jgi:predicted RNA binding protein YcfA (HicA-like mRNA interferase family)